jgi:hypothetical protein
VGTIRCVQDEAGMRGEEEFSLHLSTVMLPRDELPQHFWTGPTVMLLAMPQAEEEGVLSELGLATITHIWHIYGSVLQVPSLYHSALTPWEG